MLIELCIEKLEKVYVAPYNGKGPEVRYKVLTEAVKYSYPAADGYTKQTMTYFAPIFGSTDREIGYDKFTYSKQNVVDAKAPMRVGNGDNYFSGWHTVKTLDEAKRMKWWLDSECNARNTVIAKVQVGGLLARGKQCIDEKDWLGRDKWLTIEAWEAIKLISVGIDIGEDE